MSDKIFPEIFAWQEPDGSVEVKVDLAPEEAAKVKGWAETAINMIKEKGMNKYYVIRYRNAPECKGCDVYLRNGEKGHCTVCDVSVADRYRSRREAEDKLLEYPNMLTVAGVGDDRKAHLMADVAEVEECSSVTVR